MTSIDDLLGFPVAELSGPLLLAFWIDSMLFGVLTVQLYLYYQAFPNDGVTIKCLVYGVYCIDLIQVIVVTVDAFNSFASGFGQASALTDIGLSWLASPILGGIVALIVQSFYAFRLYRLSRSWVIPCALVVISIGVNLSGLVLGIFAKNAGDLTKLTANPTMGVAATAGVWLGGSALTDVTIAASMTYYLVKNDTGFHQTHIIITKLTRLIIETGSLSALVAVAILILFFVAPGKAYYVIPGGCIPMVYANTMLAVLNSRFRILNGRHDSDLSDVILMSIPSHVLGTRSIRVEVTREEFSSAHRDGSDNSGLMK
ncbi:hypothetical protein C8R46DRAFT_1057270 [Mycena filopes]|nr:hypothetical protein C8R46DRAFT_1057270 [Mycena filopes]